MKGLTLQSPPLTINPNANHCLLAFHRMKEIHPFPAYNPRLGSIVYYGKEADNNDNIKYSIL